MGQAVGIRGKVQGGLYGLVDRRCPPTAGLSGAVEQHLPQAPHPSVVDLDAGSFGAARQDRPGRALEEGEVHGHVEQFGLKAGHTTGHRHPFPAQRVPTGSKIWD